MFLLVLALTATEPTVDDRIARGQASIDSLDYDAAALDLTLAAQDPNATEAQRVEAYLYAGIAHRILGRDTDARLDFVYVLKHAPATELPPNVAPKIRGFYDLVKTELDLVKPTPKPAPVAPVVEPRAQTPARAVAPAGGPSAGVVVVIAGGVVAAAGGLAWAVGSVPWFQHESAVDGLARAAAAGTDGTALRAQQTEARNAWSAWGAVTSTLGGVVAGAGIVTSIVGGTMVAGEP